MNWQSTSLSFIFDSWLKRNSVLDQGPSLPFTAQGAWGGDLTRLPFLLSYPSCGLITLDIYYDDGWFCFPEILKWQAKTVSLDRSNQENWSADPGLPLNQGHMRQKKKKKHKTLRWTSRAPEKLKQRPIYLVNLWPFLPALRRFCLPGGIRAKLLNWVILKGFPSPRMYWFK